MFYEFPVINHISEVKEAIKYFPDFFIAERDGFDVVNYLVNKGEETFPPVTDRKTAILRECRGMMFDKEGNLIARGLHKFFNVSEKPEVHFTKIDINAPHIILDKLDGSMIRPVLINNEIRLVTKMGLTDVALLAEEFIKDKPNYYELFNFMSPKGALIFEFVSRKNKIVLDYAEDALILLALRSNETGEYVTYNTLKIVGAEFNIPVVKQFPGSISGMDSFLETVREMKGIEGFVIAYENGHKLKIKTDEYCLLHKTKETIATEKNVIKILVNGGIDDLLPLLDEYDRNRVEEFAKTFWHGLNLTKHIVEYEVAKFTNFNSRKDFALYLKDDVLQQYHGLIFKGVDGKNVWEEMLKLIDNKTGSQTDVDKIRGLWGDIKWSDTK